jgi:multidrug resistance efflux pump
MSHLPIRTTALLLLAAAPALLRAQDVKPPVEVRSETLDQLEVKAAQVRLKQAEAQIRICAERHDQATRDYERVVKAGQAVGQAEIDERKGRVAVARAELLQAETQVEAAQINLKRTEELAQLRLAAYKRQIARAEVRVKQVEAHIESAKANQKLAEAEYARLREAVRQGAGSARDLEVAEGKLLQARAAAVQAETDLALAKLELEEARAALAKP